MLIPPFLIFQRGKEYLFILRKKYRIASGFALYPSHLSPLKAGLPYLTDEVGKRNYVCGSAFSILTLLGSACPRGIRALPSTSRPRRQERPFIRSLVNFN